MNAIPMKDFLEAFWKNNDLIGNSERFSQSYSIFPSLQDNDDFVLSSVLYANNEPPLIVSYNASMGEVSAAYSGGYDAFSPKTMEAHILKLKGDSPDNKVADQFRKDFLEARANMVIPNTSDGVYDLDIMQSMADIKSNIPSFISNLSAMHKEYVALFKEADTVNNKKTRETKPSNNSKVESSSYQDFVSSNSRNTTVQMEKFWRTISFDAENPIQNEIARMCYYGKNVLLLGETGIGKTFNPVSIASENNVAVSMIQFNAKTDSMDLHGVDVIRKGLFDSEPTMAYRYGALSKAFIDARDRSKIGEASMIVLDELFRAEDMSPLISSLSVVEDTNEYLLILPNVIDYIQIRTASHGNVWFAVSNDINKLKQPYTLGELGGEFDLKDPVEIFICKDSSIKAEMHSRGDLYTISRQDIDKVPRDIIMKTEQEGEGIRVPQRAVMIVGTSNIGMHYDVNMSVDNAILRRLSRMPMESPSPSYMVKQRIKHITSFKSDDIKSKVETIITRFLEAVATAIDSGHINTSSRVNFSTVDDILSGIDAENPFDKGFGNIYEVLDSKAKDFSDLSMDMSATDMLLDPNIKQIRSIIQPISQEQGDDFSPGDGKSALFSIDNQPQNGNGTRKR